VTKKGVLAFCRNLIFAFSFLVVTFGKTNQKQEAHLIATHSGNTGIERKGIGKLLSRLGIDLDTYGQSLR
jgi:hypothetical protein